MAVLRSCAGPDARFVSLVNIAWLWEECEGSEMREGQKKGGEVAGWAKEKMEGDE